MSFTLLKLLISVYSTVNLANHDTNLINEAIDKSVHADEAVSNMLIGE